MRWPAVWCERAKKVASWKMFSSETSNFIEHQEELKSRVVGAMVYPLFLLTVGLIIVAVMLVKICS